MQKRKETLELIFEKVGHNLTDNNFKVNKKKDTYIRKSNNYNDKFHIRITAGGSKGIRQHVTLSSTFVPISKLYREIETKTREKLGLPPFNEFRSTSGLSDWKELYEENNIPNGTLWFTSFESIYDIDGWEKDFETMMKLSLKWFESKHDIDVIKNHCLGEAISITDYEMYLTAVKYSEPENLEERYENLEVHENVVAWDDEEFKMFYNILKES